MMTSHGVFQTASDVKHVRKIKSRPATGTFQLLVPRSQDVNDNLETCAGIIQQCFERNWKITFDLACIYMYLFLVKCVSLVKIKEHKKTTGVFVLY